MEKITIDDYKKAIQKHYEIKKFADVSGTLVIPSPAVLRDFCFNLVDDLNKQDEVVFRLFFETKNDETLKKSIINCNIDKFRTIISFLKQKTNSEIPLRIEMSAIIINFNPRPYNKYIKLVSENEVEIENDLEPINNDNFFYVDSDSLPNVEPQKKTKNKSIKNKILIFLVVIISLSSIVYTIKNFFFKRKECMQWQKNHYEYVDCNKNEFLQINQIILADESLHHLKMIEVNKNTKFFNYGKPLVWYHKHKNKIEFYNSFGFHPQTKKPLKPITNYMINKYIK